MHVTTAGVVGTWWWVPSEASSFWSTALNDSVVRATTYSFGSICFGSLLVAIVQALRALEHQSRENDDMQILRCIIQCILSCIESIIEELNRWAYVYVGLYGFSYLEAGRNVIQLFQNKGWTAIIADDLVDNVLFMMTVAIGLASGLVGLVIGFIDSNMFINLGFDSAAAPAFLVGFLAGFLFSSIIMSVVGSGVNTVIVCFAEDPAAFETNHRQLSLEMRSAWTQAWPGLIN
jgi:Plasma-membrane choline transporter